MQSAVAQSLTYCTFMSSSDPYESLAASAVLPVKSHCTCMQVQTLVSREVSEVWYGIVEFNVPLDTV